MGVVNRMFTNFERTVFAEKNCIGGADARFNGGGGTEYLHSGTRFKRIGYGPVTPQFLVIAAKGIGIEIGALSQGKDRAAFGRHDNDHA